MLAKKNIYIFLTIICILSIIVVQSSLVRTPVPKTGFRFNISEEKLSLSPKAIALLALSLVYCFIFVAGILNLIILALRKLRKIPRVLEPQTENLLPLSPEKRCKLLFLISLLATGIYLFPAVMSTFKLVRSSIDSSLLLNLALQAGTILLVLRYINLKFFGFYWKRKQFFLVLRIYSIIVPLTLISFALNSLVAEKLGIDPSYNPVIELFFLLDNKLTLSILIFQIVFLGPIAEELFFRGFIYKWVRTKYNFIISASLASAVFSFMHQVPQNILPLFVISFGLCYLYEKTQNLLPSIIFHCLHNALSLCLFLVTKSLFSS